MDWLHQNYQLVVALSALLISGLSLIVSIRTLSAQQTHNKLSVKPVVHIARGDYTNKIFVRLKNYGGGPLFIEKFQATNENGVYSKLIDIFGHAGSRVKWNTFSDGIDGRVLAPYKEITLIEWSFHGGAEQSELIDKVRSCLATTTLTVKYKCLYDQSHPIHQESLKWFGRY